jgi:hypothetical protein
MSYQDPNGSEKFWFDGVPFSGIQVSNQDGRSEKFWFDGVPWAALMPPIVTARTGMRSSVDGKARIATVDLATVQAGKYRQVALE